MKNTISLLLLISLCHFATAIPTTLVVRAQAKDAKFIGSSIGGARILIREATSGKLLAEGFTSGSTGNTKQIMQEAHSRFHPLSDAETAGFSATLDLDKPVLLTVEGYAPWHKPQARIKVATQLWLIPGKHITGDGLVLEFPGFVVDVLSPQTHETISQDTTISIKANIVMMCGCPLTKGGLWDAEKYEIRAILEKDGKAIQEIPLQIMEKASTFTASIPSGSPGLYQLTVYAYDPQSGNTGLATAPFIVK